MPYKFLEDVAIADVAFEATGKTLQELFESAGLAMTNTMVKKLSSLKPKVKKKIKIKSDNVETLLFDFLQQLVFFKDTEQLLFNKFEIEITQKKNLWSASILARGEKIDIKKHEMLVDVKGATLHNYKVEDTEEGWRTQVTLDV